MKQYIRCPCCGNQICILFKDGNEFTIFFDTQNQVELQKRLADNGIELGVPIGGDTDE